MPDVHKLFGSCDGQKMLESETLQIPWPDQLKSLLAIKFAKLPLKRVFTHSLAAVGRI